MNLPPDIRKKSDRADRMRLVMLTIFYNAEASGKRRLLTGTAHSNVISPNFFVFPPQTDEIELSKLDTLRRVWLKARRETSGLSFEDALRLREETPEEKLERLFARAAAPSDAEEEKTILSAKYPIPATYGVLLPDASSVLRREIIDTLVPFREVCAKLLRLEGTLDLPLRAVHISHDRAPAHDELKATLK